MRLRRKKVNHLLVVEQKSSNHWPRTLWMAPWGLRKTKWEIISLTFWFLDSVSKLPIAILFWELSKCSLLECEEAYLHFCQFGNVISWINFWYDSLKMTYNIRLSFSREKWCTIFCFHRGFCFQVWMKKTWQGVKKKVVELLCHVQFFAAPWTVAHQAPPSSTISWSLLKFILSLWCYLTISSSAILFSFCLQSFPASGSSPMNQLFSSGDQSIGASASASVLPMNI